MTEPDVRIGQVETEITVAEGVGPLSAAEVRQLVALVVEQVALQQERRAQLERDTSIHDRAFRPALG